MMTPIRRLPFLAFLGLFCGAALVAADKPATLTGYVSNKACDARAMKVDADACMRKCREQGNVQFIDEAEKKVWDVSNADQLAGFETKRVTLKAELDAEHHTLRVLSVQPAK